MPNPPKPSAIKKAEGNGKRDRGRRLINDKEPPVVIGAPEMPDYLEQDPRANKHWHRLCRILTRVGVLSEADGDQLASLCCALSTLEQAEIGRMKFGMFITSKRSELVRRNPYMQIIAEASARVNALCGKFGLDPSSRSRLQVEGPRTEIDPVDEAFSGGPRLVKLS